jgi:phospholipase C
VVVMMENRSFDHLLGYRRHPRSGQPNGLDPDIDGLGRGDGERFRDAAGGPALFHPVFHRSETYFQGDPPHSFETTLEQLGPDDGLRGGTQFAQRYENSLDGARKVDPNDPDLPPDRFGLQVLGYHDENEVPVLHHLAEEFCVCDSWFSSFPGSTWVNRLFLYNGESGGLTANIDFREGDERRKARRADRKDRREEVEDLEGREKRQTRRELRQQDREERHEKLEEHDAGLEYYRKLPKLMLFDVLDDSKVSWGIYHDGAVPWFRLVRRKHVGSRNESRVKFLNGLEKDLERGDLPKVVFVDPDFGGRTQNDDHSPIDLVNGQAFLKRVYNLLAAHPGVLARSALVVIWDEHGGFFDHVDPRPFHTGDLPPFHHYGVRVPALVAGGRVPPRSLSHTVFDHTSVAATALRAFAPGGLARMPPRVQRANHLGFLLTGDERSSFPPAPGTRPPVPARGGPKDFDNWLAIVEALEAITD